MDSRLVDLYQFPREPTQEDIYLEDLAAQCSHLENRVLCIADSLSPNDRAALEAYIAVRDELEYQSVKRALKIGKGIGLSHQ